MITTPTLIHIVWTGPHYFESAPEFFNAEIDFGIYQIYGSHPVNGSDVLLYIGRARGGSLGWRILQHEPWLKNHGLDSVTIYLGRLSGESTPSDDDWNEQIDVAERLLIYAHQPLLNEHNTLGSWGAEIKYLHVCNWGRRAQLLPEVSGVRWPEKHALPTMAPYTVGAHVEPDLPPGNTDDPGHI